MAPHTTFAEETTIKNLVSYCMSKPHTKITGEQRNGRTCRETRVYIWQLEPRRDDVFLLNVLLHELQTGWHYEGELSPSCTVNVHEGDGIDVKLRSASIHCSAVTETVSPSQHQALLHMTSIRIYHISAFNILLASTDKKKLTMTMCGLDHSGLPQ